MSLRRRGVNSKIVHAQQTDSAITDLIGRFDLDDRLDALLSKVRPFTMVADAKLVDLARQVVAVLAMNIPGDFVECGVWRGGAAFLIADILRQAGVTGRKVWLFDSFEGLPAPEAIDGQAALEYARDTHSPRYRNNCQVSLEDVQDVAARLGLTPHTEFVKGWFEHTLPACRNRVGTIAILRIDADWYSSVKSCLDNLYDQVADGGFVLFDDYYAYDGCALAVHEFLGSRGLSYRIESVYAEGEGIGALFRKGSVTWSEAWKPMAWQSRLNLFIKSITAAIPADATFILVDEEQLCEYLPPQTRALPFLERDGVYWGCPPDDETAINEVKRLQRANAGFIIFAWPTFWWLKFYTKLHRYLRSTFQCVLENNSLIVFDLRQEGTNQELKT